MLNELAKRLYENAKAHGFHDGEPIGVAAATPERMAIFIANLQEECSELWSAVRHGTLFDQCDKGIGISNAEEELADIIIRALDTAYTIGVDIEKSITRKAAYNKTRPYKHGRTC